MVNMLLLCTYHSSNSPSSKCRPQSALTNGLGTCLSKALRTCTFCHIHQAITEIYNDVVHKCSVVGGDSWPILQIEQNVYIY